MSEPAATGGSPDPMGDVAPESAPRLAAEEKRTYVRTLFDALAPRYDALNWVISLGQVQFWRWRAFRRAPVPEGGRVLDVGCGTGAACQALRRRHPTAVIEGMDLAPRMIELANERDGQGTYFVGDVTDIPRDDGTYDLVTSAFVTRNFPELRPSLQELVRVCRPGGWLLMLDTYRPGGPRLWQAWQRFWMRWVVPTLVAPFTDARAFRYLGESILNHVSDAECAEMLTEMGCDRTEILRYSAGTASVVLARRAGENEASG